MHCRGRRLLSSKNKLKSKTEMKEYKVKSGRHIDEKGIEHIAGTDTELVRSRRPLDKLFVNKFEFVREVEDEPEKVYVSNVPDGEEDEGEESQFSEYGEDVTDDFPNAFKEDLKVFTKNGWFSVVDPDVEEGEDPLVAKVRKKEVDATVKEYVS